METYFRHQLEEVFNRYGFPLTTEQSEQLTIYRTELKRWNARINLTALHDDTEVIYKHFLDSVSVLEHFSIAEGQTVIDVGTGAGFPGVVLKIYVPNICLTLVEASYKKVAFLKYLISQMGLDSSIQVFAERAEICAESDEFVNAYDWVLTRYVASLEKSAKYCLPMLNTTGRWIAYKSGEIDTEINQCKESIHEFGAVVAGVYTSRITQLNRTYIVVSRVNG
ncbi:16S rRNA (guanine(527)-N(7))-methyltransferase RsmG [Candidatus Poribacteria bacterium]|nr:16S rRNA (guanine(527)-N(7))-methyltransferase RsmG [Candidatus Poribacteria bacterium]